MGFGLLMAALAAGGAPFAYGGTLADTVAMVRSSVVGVGTRQDLRRPALQFRGTGFVVGDGRLVLTNAHVIPARLDIDRRETLVVMVAKGRTEVMALPARVVSKDGAHDLALLRFEKARLKPLELGDSSKVREGDRVAFTGFPIGPVLGLHPVSHRGIVSAITPIAIPQVSAQTLSRNVLARLSSPFDVFQLDATAYPGNSGSPLYDQSSGAVIGIINMVFVKESKETVLEKPSGIAYAIPAAYARKLLDKLDR